MNLTKVLVAVLFLSACSNGTTEAPPTDQQQGTAGNKTSGNTTGALASNSGTSTSTSTLTSSTTSTGTGTSTSTSAGATSTGSVSTSSFTLKGTWTLENAKKEGGICVARENGKGITDEAQLKKICYCGINKVMIQQSDYVKEYQRDVSATVFKESIISCGGK